MKIELYAISKLRDPNLLPLCNEYSSRIKGYTPFEVKEIKSINGAPPPHETFLLDESGKKFDSIQFSEMLKGEIHGGRSKMSFLIGDADGWSEEERKRFPNRLSLSPMTFQHDIARLLFLEQLYRAFTILQNHPYHR